MTQTFDFELALKALQSGQPLTGRDGILTPLIKPLTEAPLTAERDFHLAQDTAKTFNCRGLGSVVMKY